MQETKKVSVSVRLNALTDSENAWVLRITDEVASIQIASIAITHEQYSKMHGGGEVTTVANVTTLGSELGKIPYTVFVQLAHDFDDQGSYCSELRLEDEFARMQAGPALLANVATFEVRRQATMLSLRLFGWAESNDVAHHVAGELARMVRLRANTMGWNLLDILVRPSEPTQ